jgi:hypothetical protein
MILLAPVVAAAVVAAPSLASASRSGDEEYDFPGSSRDLNARLDAYVPVMREARDAAESEGKYSAPAARRLAAIWWDGERQGRLLSIPLSRSGESSMDGVSGQIVRTANRIGLELTASAADLARKGDAPGAVADSLRSMEVMRSLHYSDMITCSLADACYRQNLETISRMSEKLTPGQRANASTTLRELQLDGTKLESMLRGMYGLYVQSATEQRRPVKMPALGLLRRCNGEVATLASLKTLQTQVNRESSRHRADPFLRACNRVLRIEINTQIVWQRTETALAA